MQTVSGSFKSVKAVKGNVFSILNSSIFSHSALIGSRLCIKIKHRCQTSRFDGLYLEIGVAGMLEAFIYDAVDIASTFLYAVVDECRGLIEIANMTKVFKTYVDVINFFFCRQYLSPARSEKELKISCPKMRLFEILLRHVFESYPPSKMRTKTWHALVSSSLRCNQRHWRHDFSSCRTIWVRI